MSVVNLLTIHPLLTERVRLAMLAALASEEKGIEFTELLKSLDLTRGNLAAHARKLEESGLISVTKEFVDRKPRTTYHCTKDGRTAIQQYLKIVESALKTLK